MIKLLLIILSVNLLSVDLQTARENFYKATEDESYLEYAINNFNEIKGDSGSDLCDVYLGSLTALRAKYTIWPARMLKYANEGIKLMEKAKNNSPKNIEVLFVYGTTCHYLPFFFEKSEDSKKALLSILELKNEFPNYDKEILKNAIKFIIEEVDIDDKDLKKAEKILLELNA